MKKAVLILISVLLFSTLVAGQTTKTIYTCPMHPEVQQSKPGNCPKCGMTLEKKTIKVNPPKQPAKKPQVKPVQKPVTPKINQTKPTDPGTRPDSKPDTVKPVSQAKVVYTCVMHPEVQMDKPGNCPKCGMVLIKKTVGAPESTDSTGAHQQ